MIIVQASVCHILGFDEMIVMYYLTWVVWMAHGVELEGQDAR